MAAVDYAPCVERWMPQWRGVLESCKKRENDKVMSHTRRHSGNHPIKIKGKTANKRDCSFFMQGF